MAYRGTLTIEDKTFYLLECISVVRQKTDSRGRPASEIVGGNLQVTVRGSDNDILTNWATDKKKRCDGVITLYLWDQDVKSKEISFKNAFLTFFSESYMADPERDIMKVTHRLIDTVDQAYIDEIHRIHEQFKIGYIFMLNISAEQIDIDGIQHSNKW